MSSRAAMSGKPTRPHTLRSADDLAAAGLVAPGEVAGIARVGQDYAIGVTPALAELIRREGRDGPIARQFIPSLDETTTLPAESGDPIGDDAHSPVEGIVHRYPDRVLLKLVHVCAVYCRFCFRRAMVGPGRKQTLSPEAVAAALDYVRAHPEIWEVILTGGDPLVLSARRLREAAAAIAAIAHVQVLRIHTRLPVADPAKVTPALVRALKVPGVTSYVVLHVNHASELTPAVRAACARFVDAGIPMLSQSVLLKGVNDDAATLETLMRALVACRIKPYYLHHADLAPGTAHFRTTIAEGQALMRALRGRLSGLCQPDYVLDIPGGHGKVPLSAPYASVCEAADTLRPTRYTITDYCGGAHDYVDQLSGKTSAASENL